jgi:hypothetical protein
VKSIQRVAVIGTADPIGMPGSVARGFASLGLEVTLVPYADWTPQVRLPFRGAGVLTRGVVEAVSPALAVRALAVLRQARPELVIVMKCDDLPPWFEAAVRRLTRATLVAFHPDDPWNVGQGLRRGPAHPRAVGHLARADLAFLWSRALVARAESVGVRARWLPFACDPALHPPGAGVAEPEAGGLGSELIFVGNWDEERERVLGPLAESGLDLAIWGTDYWRDRCRNKALQAAWRGRPLLAAEQGVALRASGLSVNILRRQNKGSTNMRTFEVPCMGGFALHEASDEAAHYFPAGVAAAYFEGPADLVVQARAWLEAPREVRAAIAAEGQRRALAWTYQAWAEAVLTAVGAVAPGPRHFT